MARIGWPHHEAGSAQGGTLAVAVGVVLVTFLALATAATVYDIGKWLAAW